MEDTECGAQGTPRHGGKGHSFNRTLPCLPIPVIVWNNRSGASPTTKRRTPAEATMRTTPVPRTTTGGPQQSCSCSSTRAAHPTTLRIRVAVVVSLERSHSAVQHLIQPDGNLHGPGQAASPHLPRPDGPLLHGLGQAVGPHFTTRPRRPIGPAKQTVALFSHTSTTRPIRRSNGPAKQTVASFLFPSTRPSRQLTYTYNSTSTSTAISAAGLHRSPRRSSRLVPSRFRGGGDKYISLSASLRTTSQVYR